MSDEVERYDDDELVDGELVDDDAPYAPQNEGDEGYMPPAIIPVPDGVGGTKYVVPGTDEEKTYEEWQAQNQGGAQKVSVDERYGPEGEGIDEEQPAIEEQPVR